MEIILGEEDTKKRDDQWQGNRRKKGGEEETCTRMKEDWKLQIFEVYALVVEAVCSKQVSTKKTS